MDDPDPKFYLLKIAKHIPYMMSLLDVSFQIKKNLIKFTNEGTRTMN